MATRSASRLHDLADQYRGALAARDEAAADELARTWTRAAQRVEVEIQSLVAKMEAARQAGVEIKPAWLYQEKRLANLLAVIRTEVRAWAPSMSTTVREHAEAAVSAAQTQARNLVAESLGDIPAGVVADLGAISPAVAATITAHLAAGPLTELLLGYGEEAAQMAQTALTQGVILGKGSDWIATQLRKALDVPRWRAETLARTEALRAYRETTRQTYLATDVVVSWYWSATLDRRTCPGCVVMHGTEHPLTEILDDHPRGRCVMIPRTKPWSALDPSLKDAPEVAPPTLGSDWLEAQPALSQRAILGPLKYDAWKAGRIKLSDVVARTHSLDWGTMRRERSMLEILQGRNANTLPRVP